MSDQAEPKTGMARNGITGHAAGCLFTLHPDGALSLRRPATSDQEALAIELSAAELIALQVFFDAIDVDRLLDRLAADR